MSILDKKISVYNGVTDREGKVTYLSNFLFSKRHRAEIEQLRRITDPDQRRLRKLALPMATVSGLFSPTRKIENLREHSGYICIDIDGKDNPTFTLDRMREVLTGRPDVAYAAMSVSGQGMFGVIPLLCPQRQDDHFQALKAEFRDRYGLVLDDCGDVTRLRALSWDPDAYVNESATLYTNLSIYLPSAEDTPPAPGGPGTPSSPAPLTRPGRLIQERGDERKVARCCEVIEQNRIDITSSYQEWFSIGASLASLGERGRYYFHVVSRQNAKYRYVETDRKFSELLRTVKRVGLGTFFYWCSQYGITYKREGEAPE